MAKSLRLQIECEINRKNELDATRITNMINEALNGEKPKTPNQIRAELGLIPIKCELKTEKEGKNMKKTCKNKDQNKRFVGCPEWVLNKIEPCKYDLTSEIEDFGRCKYGFQCVNGSLYERLEEVNSDLIAPDIPDPKIQEEFKNTGKIKPALEDSGDRTNFDTGAVRDMHEGKGRCDLLPPAALLRLARHFENGAKKYGDRNWELGIPCHSFADSAHRHYLQYMDGATNEDHLMAAIWNLMCLAETEEKHPEMMDIPSRIKTNDDTSEPSVTFDSAADFNSFVDGLGRLDKFMDIGAPWGYKGSQQGIYLKEGLKNLNKARELINKKKDMDDEK